jgi:hypothetical protein
MPNSSKAFAATAAVLALWMLATRLPDASALLHLRDASMAVFFLGGLLLRRHAGFVGLIVLAFVIDASVFARAGNLDACFTPAYAFLLPAYAVLFYGGRLLAPGFDGAPMSLARAVPAGVACALVSFLISNGSFYLFSGAFGELGVGVFAEQFLRYAPGFVLTGSAWIALGLVTAAVLVRAGWLPTATRAA